MAEAAVATQEHRRNRTLIGKGAREPRFEGMSANFVPGAVKGAMHEKQAPHPQNDELSSRFPDRSGQFYKRIRLNIRKSTC